MSSNSPMFWIVVCLINVWKEVGWDTIIYLSAMAGIDQGIYEEAKVDGANRHWCLRGRCCSGNGSGAEAWRLCKKEYPPQVLEIREKKLSQPK